MSFAAHFVQFPRLETPRLVLRRAQPGDAPDYFAQLNHVQVRRHYGTADCAERRSLAGARAILAHRRADFCRHLRIDWMICLKRTGRLVGGCALFDFRHHATAELGYWLARRHWGKGLMTEAVTAVLDHAFRTMGLRRVCASTDVDNLRSVALLRRLGFTQEGVLRRHARRDHGWSDSAVFGLLVEEHARVLGVCVGTKDIKNTKSTKKRNHRGTRMNADREAQDPDPISDLGLSGFGWG